MPDFPIVDTHLHIWDTGRLRYPWLDDVPLLNRPYLIDDYRSACGGVIVEKMVFLQAEVDFSLFRAEADWVSSVAAEDPRIEGIVAWAPLQNGEAADEDLAALASNPLMRGIRRIIQFEDDIEFCLQPDFIRGVQLLPRHGLTFDICINHVQMANTIRMVERSPDVSFILDHIGKPDIRNQVFDPWRSEIKTLSEFPNVWCKMSGLVSEADPEHWNRDDLRPYIDHVLDCFGFDRTMFGGDWPVVLLASEQRSHQRSMENLFRVAGW